MLFIARGIPALGYEVYRVVPAPETDSQSGPGENDLSTSHPFGPGLRLDLDHGWLENRFYRLEFDLWSGVLTRLVDKTNEWEVIPQSRAYGNTVVKERDYGNFWQYNGPCKGDALNPTPERYPLPELDDPRADFAHLTQGDGLIRNGRAMVEFSVSHPFGSGQYATRVRLYAGLPRIDIQTTLVNGDERVRYRAVIPTSIQGGTITYEIPFGAIQRPEGEYPAQNWIDYSVSASAASQEHGVTLLNRGLPGNNVAGGVMMLSLLKCTALKEGYGEFKLEDATRQGYEIGKPHTFEYALVTHGGDWRAGTGLPARGRIQPPAGGLEASPVCRRAPEPCSLPGQDEFSESRREEYRPIRAENLPWRDDRQGLRSRRPAGEGCLSGAGLAGTGRLRGQPGQKEEKEISLPSPTRRLDFSMKPFEIKTFKLIF